MNKQVFNPYLPLWEYIPDGEPYVFGDRLYVYGSHDKFNGETYCMNDYVCWSAPVNDLADWRYEGVIYRKDQDPERKENNYMYAPDITVGPDGRYYLYYTLDMTGTMAVAVADNPTGPFDYYGRVHYPDGRVLGREAGDYYQFDPGLLVEDGRVWLYSGFAPGRGTDEEISAMFGGRRLEGAWCIELEQDMLTVKSQPVCIAPRENRAKGTSFEEHPFFEASSIRKINGKYYFVYSSTWSHELCYAISDYPNRDFRFGGTIISNGDIGLENRTVKNPANYVGNNHGGMVQVNGQWYIFHHRQTNYHDHSRQGCAEPITILPDGSIPQVEMTSCGLNGGDLVGRGRYSAAIACQLYAAQGGAYVWQGEKLRAEHPAFTQAMEDQEQDAEPYITNLRNGAVVGFKYFDLSETQTIGVEIRGSAGTLRIRDKTGNRLMSEISFEENAEYRQYTGTMTGGTGHCGLFFEVQTEGTVDFRAFTLA